jgi:hypothetical protein
MNGEKLEYLVILLERAQDTRDAYLIPLDVS